MRFPRAVLGDVLAEVQPGFASGAVDPAGVFQIRMNNVTRDGRWDLSKRRYVPATTEQRERFAVAQGDIIFNATNSPELVGKTALAAGFAERTVFSNHFLRLRAERSKLDPAFLARWLQSQFRLGVFASMCVRWVNQATVKRDRLQRMAIPLPPIDEQRRIARILDIADSLRAHRREASVALGALLEATFLEMFGDPVANPKDWPRVPIREAGRVITGNTPSREESATTAGSVGWVKSDNLSEHTTFVTSPVESVSRTASRAPRIVGPGAVLVTCIAGSPRAIGNVAIADREVAFNQQINAIEPRAMGTGFLYVQLRLAKRLVQAASSGGMKGLVNKTRFAGIGLIAPPRPRRGEFEERFCALERAKRRSEEHLAHLDDLFASLEASAFSGEL